MQVALLNKIQFLTSSEMFGNLKTTTLALAAAASALFSGGQAWALDLTTTNTRQFLTVGECRVSIYYAPTAIGIAAGNDDTSFQAFVGGTLWGSFRANAVVSPFTYSVNFVPGPFTNFGQDAIERSCPGVSDIQIIRAVGPGENGVSRADQEYLGFEFCGTEGGTRYRYEFALQGAQNTTIIAERTREDNCPNGQAPTNEAPTADAGPDQTVGSGAAPVTLDGTGSNDPDGTIASYAWTQTGGPTVSLSDDTAASPTFTAPTLAQGDPDTELTFELVVTDNDGLTSTDTVTITVVAALTVELSGGPSEITNTNPFNVTATFARPVTGFDDLAADVIVTNGTVTSITQVSQTVYTLAVQPTGNGDVSITVPAGAATENRADGFANLNLVSNTLVIGNRIVAITQEQIAGFMLGRANNLASNQPGLTRFLMGDGCRNASIDATEESGFISGCVSEGNVWADITSSWSGDGSYTLGTLGAHAFANPNLLIGGMVQFDYMDDPANNASGTGWMVGPYFVARVPEQPLYFEGRLLYGQTSNEITPLGTYTDSFETERWLAQLRATGEYNLQNTTLMPLLDFTYTQDSQLAYTDSLGNTIPEQTVSLMQLSAGLDFSQPLPVSSGLLNLTGGFSAIYSSTNGAAAAAEFEAWRGRTHLGLNYDTGTGATMNVGAFYDGIGTGYESYGAQAGFDWRF